MTTALGFSATQFGAPTSKLTQPAQSVTRLVQTGVIEPGPLPLYVEDFSTDGPLNGEPIPSLDTTWYAMGTRSGGQLVPGSGEVYLSTGPNTWDVESGHTDGDGHEVANNANADLGVRCETAMVVTKLADKYGANSRFYIELNSTNFLFGVWLHTPLGGTHTVAFNAYSGVGESVNASSSNIEIAPLFTTSDNHTFVFRVDGPLLSMSIDGVQVASFDISAHEIGPVTESFQYFYIFFIGHGLDHFSITDLDLVGEPIPIFSQEPLAQVPEPIAFQSWRAASVGQVTKWNYPYVGYVAHPLFLDAEGFMSAKVGFPQRISLPFQPANTFVRAKGFKPTEAGTPASVSATAVQASGSTSTAFGTPTRPQFFAATGFNTPAFFGQAASSFSTRAAGFKATAYAAPTHRRTQPAASPYRAVRWGMPVAERSNTFKTYGINCSSRFGRPTGYQRFNYPVMGMRTTQHGAHTSFEMRHATMIPPTQQFGKPLLKRTPLC